MEDSKVSTRPEAPKRKNPFAQMIEDMRRINEAIQNGEPLSSLKDIEFVTPLQLDSN